MKVLFNLRHLYYLPQFWPVMLTLRDQGWAEINVSLSRRVTPDEYDTFLNECRRFGFSTITAESESQRLKTLQQQKYDVLFVGNKTDVIPLKHRATKVVMIYHGIGLKQSYYTDINSRIDLLTVESQERMAALSRLSCEKVLSGFTKLDPLAWDDERREPFLTLPQDMVPDPDLPTLLYAPTFYPSSVEKIIPVLAGFSLPVNILVKLHQFSWTKRKYRHHIELVHQARTANPRLTVFPESFYNILPAYYHSDLLISDISSTLFEYLAVNRPIIQTHMFTPRIKHRIFPGRLRKRLDAERFESVDFVYSCRESERLEEACEKRLAGDDPLAEKRKAARTKYLYRLDGKASERLLRSVKRIVSSV